ncbi:hypothetical protein sos41_11390 [Alphaproteobacteria bacterium SO-S41]|nr:hypothetical protein sos41_11390 [Alphaproteobacteria bacterium SO-S41]
MTAPSATQPVVLAREGAFTLGTLRIDPPLREVMGADRCESLEPRVMQVLVALHRARGAIVTRDELTMSCWGGRVVGEDAINRALGRLRRLAQQSDAFQLETIRKVGYRLTVLPAATFAPDVVAYAPPVTAERIDPIAAGYLSLPRAADRSRDTARQQHRRADLKHAALIAGFALAATQFAQAPQYVASDAPRSAPVVVAATNGPEGMSGGSLKLARLLSFLDQLRPAHGGQSAPGGRLPPIRVPGAGPTAPGETPAFQPYAPPLLSRTPDYTINWPSPSTLYVRPFVHVTITGI